MVCVHEEWTDTGIFDENGRLVEIQSVGRDITERKQAENEIRRQREAAHLREKLASLGSLLAGVAHELNNPLSVVVGRAIMLEDEVEDPRARVSLADCALPLNAALESLRPSWPSPVTSRARLNQSISVRCSMPS